ncbi:MAG: hypothetical protein JSW07_14350, partial [bacterium]
FPYHLIVIHVIIRRPVCAIGLGSALIRKGLILKKRLTFCCSGNKDLGEITATHNFSNPRIAER